MIPQPDASVPRVFLDANVFIKGIVSNWGAAKAVLILGTLGLIQIETSAVVRREVEHALDSLGVPTGPGSEVEDLLRLVRLVVWPIPSAQTVEVSMPRLLPYVRHLADVAVVVAAIQAAPDWLLSENTRHFNQAVAEATGLKIATPRTFLEWLIGPSQEPQPAASYMRE
jgi:hypothetical protein